MDIYTDFTLCSITDLGTENNDFVIGSTDLFQGDELQGCDGFEVPEKKVSQLVLSHTGVDAWLPKYVDIHFDDADILHCPDGEWLDNRQEHILDCKPYLFP